MSVRNLKILSLTLLFLLSAGSAVVFAQARPGRPLPPRDTARPGQGMSREDAMNQQFSLERQRQEEKAYQAEIDEARWQAEQDRLAAEREAAMRARPSIDRKSPAGFQSPTELNEALEAMQPGAAIELHGDLFTAADGMILSATYYRGANGKESVPVVLLHGKGGSRRDFDPIIPALLKEGMSVLVPDIRGHGKSIEFIIEEFGEPTFFPIDPANIPPNPLASNWLAVRWDGYERFTQNEDVSTKPVTKINMKRIDKYEGVDYACMGFDLQVWQNFLINENNQERLNIRKLNLVGVEMGAGLAAFWCRCDPGSGASRQTKTLTLISPVVARDSMEEKNGTNLPLGYLNTNAMRNSLATMIIIGKDDKRVLQDAEAVKATLLGKGKKDEESGLKAKYPLISCNTEKQGRDLFSLTSAKIDQGIPLFIKDRLGKLEAAAAEKKNDKSLVWSGGKWNAKPKPKT